MISRTHPPTPGALRKARAAPKPANGGSDAERLQALLLKATAEDQLGRSEAAIASLTEALALSGTAALSEVRLRLLDQLADRLYTVGHYREALEHWMACIALAVDLGDIAGYVQAYMAVGGVFDAAGAHERGLQQHERALAYSSALTDPQIHVNVRLYLASDYVHFGRHAEALEILDDADRVISVHDFATHRAETSLHRGMALLALGKTQTALVCLREGARQAEQANHPWAHTMCLMRLGQAHDRLRNPHLAEQVLRSALVLAESGDFKRQQREIQQTLAILFEEAGRAREALGALRATHALDLELARHAPVSALEPHLLKRLDKLDTRLRLELSRQENQRLRETQNSQDQLLHRLHIEAYQDALTGLANRRWLDAQLAEKLGGWQGQPPISLLVLDIDHFKAINDDFSHLVGDAVLRQVSELLRQACRGHDTPVRFGGEEFVVVLEGLPLHEATLVAERIRVRIASHDWHAILGNRPLTLSAGVTEALPGDNAATLIIRADEALYRAKRNGRNRIEAATA
ncbi:Response regulator PleD [Andreprevotia sp. IGB-42]|uniref:GGDEF domain-containing protein n=1 Tax=Andreprevotia sp. IGB-42 TaxID=2497473 RepID=UPI00135BE595|nr:GGDEF domain-containing protein [Andreprevotia sp. IGB-42]KAF0814737.1 Response regulator PleD [Andreprevotia sp. IGB-42]